MREWIKRWTKQGLCEHLPVKTTQEEYERTGYLFRCANCGKYLRWYIESTILCDYRFWVGMFGGVLVFCLIVHILLAITKQ